MIDEEGSRERLLETVKPGDTLHTVVRHVTGSGMTRWIDVYKLEGGDAKYLSYWVAKVVESPINTGGHDGIKRGGCGMDMGFDLVYSLARALWPEGYACIGEGCPANDHANGDRDYTPGHVVHRDGGYALNQRWL